MGVFIQVRVLGGVIGLAMAQAILTRSLASKLESVLSGQQIAALLDSTGSISRFIFAQAKSTRKLTVMLLIFRCLSSRSLQWLVS